MQRNLIAPVVLSLGLLTAGCGAETTERQSLFTGSLTGDGGAPDALPCDRVCIGFPDGQVTCKCRGTTKPPCNKLRCLGETGSLVCACDPRVLEPWYCAPSNHKCWGDPDKGVTCACVSVPPPCELTDLVCVGHPDHGVLCSCTGNATCSPGQIVCTGHPDRGVTCKCEGPSMLPDGGPALPLPDAKVPPTP